MPSGCPDGGIYIPMRDAPQALLGTPIRDHRRADRFSPVTIGSRAGSLGQRSRSIRVWPNPQKFLDRPELFRLDICPLPATRGQLGAETDDIRGRGSGGDPNAAERPSALLPLTQK